MIDASGMVPMSEVYDIGTEYFGIDAHRLIIEHTKSGWMIDAPLAEKSDPYGTYLFVEEPGGRVHQIPECPPL